MPPVPEPLTGHDPAESGGVRWSQDGGGIRKNLARKEMVAKTMKLVGVCRGLKSENGLSERCEMDFAQPCTGQELNRICANRGTSMFAR